MRLRWYAPCVNRASDTGRHLLALSNYIRIRYLFSYDAVRYYGMLQIRPNNHYQ